MKKIVSLTLLLTFLNANLAWSVGKVQNEDVKSVTDLTNAGSDQTHLINTDKIYDILNAQQLSSSISSGALGGSGGSGGIELLSNTGFEGGTTGWTASGGTLTTVNSGSNLIAGNKSGQWTASASSQTLSSAALAVKGLAGGQCSASMYYLYAGTAGDYIFRVIDGSSNVLASTSLGVQSLANTQTILSFPCGSSTSSTLQWQIISNVASPSVIYVDTTHLGSLTVQQASQGQLVGGVAISGCATQLTNTSSGSFASLTGSGCTYTPFGNVQSSGSQTVSFKMSGGSGDYKVEIDAQLGNSVSTDNTYFQLTDGTNLSREIDTVTGGTGLGANLVSQTIAEPGGFTNLTFEFKAKVSAGTATVTTANQLAVIRVYYYPSSSTSTVSVGQQPQSWSGYFDTGATWSRTNTSFGAMTATGTPNLVTQPGSNMNFGTVTAAAGNVPGLTFTPSTAGSFLFLVNTIASNTTSGNTIFQLTDGTTPLGMAGLDGASSSANSFVSLSLQGVENAASVSPITVSIQCLASAGACSIPNLNSSMTQRINWTIIKLNTALGAAQMNGPGQVNSSSSTNERSERATITHTANSTCAISSQSGSWLSSVACSSVGAVTLNFAASEFSSAPSCTCTVDNQAGYTCTNSTAATSSAVTNSTRDTAAAQANVAYDIICRGPH